MLIEQLWLRRRGEESEMTTGLGRKRRAPETRERKN